MSFKTKITAGAAILSVALLGSPAATLAGGGGGSKPVPPTAPTNNPPTTPTNSPNTSQTPAAAWRARLKA